MNKELWEHIQDEKAQGRDELRAESQVSVEP